jgi:zinc protease
VNALARSSFTEKNRVVLVAAPQKAGIVVPDSRAMLAVFDRAKGSTLTAYVDSTSDAPLVPTPPTPGKIVAESTLPETGILEWRLSNGARVLLKPTDFKADEVLFAARSPGGSSLLPERDMVNAELSSAVLAVSGVGQFNQVALGKRLTGKRAQVSAMLGETDESLQGSASSRDVETMFQLAWLRFTQPRVDSSAFMGFKNQMRAMMANSRNTPESAFSDTIALTMTQHNPRIRLLAPELLDSVDLRRSLAIFRERFADASGFTFYLVGAFRPDSVRPLVERYLASLPATHHPEAPRDNGVRPPTGVVERTVRKGVEPKAQTVLLFTGTCKYGYDTRVAMSALSSLLDIRLREVLRADKGGTYGVSVGANCSHIPYERYQVSISFGSAPERVDELVNATFAVIDSVKSGAISDSNLTKIREITVRSHETALRRNGAWLSAMIDADEDGRDQRDFLRLPQLMMALTREQLRDAARLYLRRDQYARFTLLPQSKGGDPAR